MTGPAPAGLFIYAKTLATMAAFYETLLAMTRVHASDDLVVLQSPDLQLVLHAIPQHIADDIVIDVPPQLREDAALKFFFTVPSLDAARAMAPGLGGAVMVEAWRGGGFVACNAFDPEGNLFQLREISA